MKKIMTVKFNMKLLLAFIAFFALVCLLAIPISLATISPKANYVIVIDAGHGGQDGGSVGVVTGKEESELTLEYARCLKSYFENFSFKVVMTRMNMNGLYSALSQNKKKSDMQKRREIIERANPDLLVSIHMNSFPLKSSKGAQVFYKEDDKPSHLLAKSIQNQFTKDIKDARKSCADGDFFILNCAKCPAVLIEFGFLSNPEEDKLLSTESYKEKMCYSTFCGVVSFLGADNL